MENVCENRDRIFNGVNGQNVSVTFRVRQPLLNTQYLKWMGNRNTIIAAYTPSNQDSTIYTNTRRRHLVEDYQNNTYKLSIKFAQESDSGTHTVYIYDGFRQVCKAFVLILRIHNTDPTCNALLHHTRGKIEMSCRWVQVDRGDYAEIVAGERAVSKDETAMNDWGLNLQRNK